MAIRTHSAETLDDLLYEVFQTLLADGTGVKATRGDTLELRAVGLELTNPLARLSRSEERRIVFSCLGELCWYWSGSDELATIKPYISRYVREAVDGRIPSAYGPRLFGPPPGDQMDRVLSLLAKRPPSRQAVLQLFDADDLQRNQRDVPCTCSLQFLVRDSAVDAVAYMRSNDALYGLPHDVFCFTMLQEMVARTLGVALGTYCHFVGSLHFYTTDEKEPTKHRETMERFIAEGFQSTKAVMPRMPDGDPRPTIRTLLAAEAAAREGQPIPWGELTTLDPYWQDLARLLEAYFIHGADAPSRIMAIRKALANCVYTPYFVALAAKRAETN
jgi:thymidylate synthase